MGKASKAITAAVNPLSLGVPLVSSLNPKLAGAIASPLTLGTGLLAKALLKKRPKAPGGPDEVAAPVPAPPPTPGTDPTQGDTDATRRRRLRALQGGIASTIRAGSPMAGMPSTMPVLKEKLGL